MLDYDVFVEYRESFKRESEIKKLAKDEECRELEEFNKRLIKKNAELKIRIAELYGENQELTNKLNKFDSFITKIVERADQMGMFPNRSKDGGGIK